jgi:hypothetical protein
MPTILLSLNTKYVAQLAQAELSTFSRSAKLLPRTIYLSHQLSFHTLGEDYHALIRRYQLDISRHQIEVRSDQCISARRESFVEGFPPLSCSPWRSALSTFPPPCPPPHRHQVLIPFQLLLSRPINNNSTSIKSKSHFSSSARMHSSINFSSILIDAAVVWM